MEIIGQIILEGLAYWVGKAVASVFLPHLGIEPFEKQKQAPRWKWRGGFVYQRASRRYLYTESIQLVGIVTLLLAGVATAVMVRYAS